VDSDGLCPLRVPNLVPDGVIEAPQVALAGLSDGTWKQSQSQSALDPHAVSAGLANPILTGQPVSWVLVTGECDDA
jgi:hypothetical protein